MVKKIGKPPTALFVKTEEGNQKEKEACAVSVTKERVQKGTHANPPNEITANNKHGLNIVYISSPTIFFLKYTERNK